MPDIEVFYRTAYEIAAGECLLATTNVLFRSELLTAFIAQERIEGGWYWHLPDGEPNGPFATESEALVDAQDARDVAHDGNGAQ
jgi:hypothetical protein